MAAILAAKTLPHAPPPSSLPNALALAPLTTTCNLDPRPPGREKKRAANVPSRTSGIAVVQHAPWRGRR
eukprot:CAMPEP_0119542040 /NCGR_PEP_ID=MMETSP1344-20130328/53339_1 /TAXON_ID=236787 /ORGANISM="Florenciella parvula, Strain CCMP2471" /LENGTH=68 /DNA_ID=CAMNT_0007586169 /DNA_START=335 /DNA_END=539 /DNA_ORIENTATION=+